MRPAAIPPPPVLGRPYKVAISSNVDRDFFFSGTQTAIAPDALKRSAAPPGRRCAIKSEQEIKDYAIARR
jgi:hypothetical protein